MTGWSEMWLITEGFGSEQMLEGRTDVLHVLNHLVNGNYFSWILYWLFWSEERQLKVENLWFRPSGIKMNVHDDRRLNEHHVLFFVPGVHTFHTTLLIRLSNFQFFLSTAKLLHTRRQKLEQRVSHRSPLFNMKRSKLWGWEFCRCCCFSSLSLQPICHPLCG